MMNLMGRRRFTRTLLVALAALVGTGCGLNWGQRKTHSKRDAQGNIILLDTPEMWQQWVSGMDSEIRHEADGWPPPGGWKTWDERWLRTIRALEKGGQENHPKYINYIIERRHQAGLPEIEGYP